MKDKELVCRSIINIIDAKKCTEFVRFYDANICDIVYQYMKEAVIKDEEQADIDIKQCIEKHRRFLECVVRDEEFDYTELKNLRESMMTIKHKYYM